LIANKAIIRENPIIEPKISLIQARNFGFSYFALDSIFIQAHKYSYMRFQIFIALILLMCVSCKTQHKTPYDFEGQQIIFGQGGGFTGQVVEYTLLENGQLFTGTNQEGFVDELSKLDKKLVKQIFSMCKKYGFEDLKIDNPANQYYYFITKDGEKMNKVLWGVGDKEVPKELKILFGNLKNLTKTRVESRK